MLSNGNEPRPDMLSFTAEVKVVVWRVMFSSGYPLDFIQYSLS
jgi:hypothetical protein